MSTDNKKSFSKEGYSLMGVAFEVYNELGHGLLEEIYQQAMEIELELRSIQFESKKQLEVYYKSRKLDKIYIPDLYVFGGIIVELKSVDCLNADHEAQLFNYMKITGTNVGYLINFGSKDELKWKRYIVSSDKEQSH